MRCPFLKSFGSSRLIFECRCLRADELRDIVYDVAGEWGREHGFRSGANHQ